jgi:acyl carrier protein|tara:strand:+ start:1943 stop:2176 length:234 start_codon:yes stop_codon:yes gene_type:complete
MSKETLKGIVHILNSDKFNIEFDIELQTKITDLSDWDSIKHLTFFFEIENYFDIEVNPDEVISIITVNDLLKMIEKK